MHLPGLSHYNPGLPHYIQPNETFQGLANNYRTHKESVLTIKETVPTPWIVSDDHTHIT